MARPLAMAIGVISCSLMKLAGSLAKVTAIVVAATIMIAPPLGSLESSVRATDIEWPLAVQAQSEQNNSPSSAVTEEPISFDFKQTDIKDVLRALALLRNVTIIPDESVKGIVTVHASDTNFDHALQLLLEANGFFFTKPDEKTYVVHKNQPLPPYSVIALGETVEISAENADVLELLKAIATATSTSIVPDPTVSGKVSIHLRRLSLEDGLSSLLTPLGFKYHKETVSDGSPVYFVSRARQERIKTVMKAGGTFDLTVQDAPLSEVAEELTKNTQQNIVLSPEVQGNVTITLQNVTLETALESLFKVRGLKVVPASGGNTLLIVREQNRPPSGVDALEFRDGVLTIAARDVNVLALSQLITEKTGLNIVADRESANATVSGSLRDVPVDQAIRVLFEANGFQVFRRDKFYLIKRSTLSNTLSIIRNDDGTFTLDVSSTDLATVLRELSARAEADIIIHGYVRAQVGNVHVAGLTLDEAFTELLKGTGYSYLKLGKIYIVGDASPTHPDSAIFSTTAVIPLQYITIDSLITLLPPSVPTLSVKPIRDQNAVVITGPASVVDELRAFLRAIDVPPSGQITRTIKLEHAEVDEVVQILNRQFPGLLAQVMRSQKRILLRTSEALMQEVEALIHDLDKPNGIETELMSLQHIKAEEAARLLPAGLGKDGVIIVADQNALLVSGDQIYRDALRNHLSRIDVKTPQLLFDVLIVEFLDNEASKTGVNVSVGSGGWSIKSNPANSEPFVGSLSATSALDSPSLAVTINALVQAGKAKVLANPKLSALSGRTASFSVITKSRYWDPRFEQANNGSTGSSGSSGGDGNGNNDVAAFRTVETGIRLLIKPWVSGSGEITMEIQPEISDTSGTGSSGLPQTNERSANTTVRVRDGDTIIIGGLIQNVKHKNTTKAPFLGDLPVLGTLFRSEDTVDTQSEFVICITPHLIDSAAESTDLFQPSWPDDYNSLETSPAK